MEDVERISRFLDALTNEIMGQKWSIWWLSFADPTKPANSQFLGVAIVKALGNAHAMKKARDLGINPGGEIAAYELPLSPECEEHYGKHMDKLLSKAYLKKHDIGQSTKDG